MKNNKELGNQQNELLTVEQKLRQKKMLVFPLMFIVFGLCMWFIFSPSKLENSKETKGFNTMIPMPKNKVLLDDKKAAFEQAKLEKDQSEQKHSLQDLASMFGEENQKLDDNEVNMESASSVNYKQKNNRNRQPIVNIQSSNNAYRQINRNLGSFFESSEDPESNKKNQNVTELSQNVQESNSRKSTIADQIELMEKSYQMAAKYIPQSQTVDGKNNQLANASLLSPKRKCQLSSISQQIEQAVSSLPQTVDSIGLDIDQKPHNTGFNTPVGSSLEEERNTIKACIHESCSLINGKSVRLRLLEPMQIGTHMIPVNSMISGEAKIQRDRLEISIQSVEYRGIIIPVELTVYDTDGQEGIYIPGSMEINAFKEMMGSIGSNLGSNVSFNQSASQQLTSGLGKGLIQSGSQYLSKKFQTVKVKLKAGYNVLLLTNQ